METCKKNYNDDNNFDHFLNTSGRFDVHFLDQLPNDVISYPLYILALLAPIQILSKLVMKNQVKQTETGKLDILKITLTLVLTSLLSWKMSVHYSTSLADTRYFSVRNQLATYIFVIFLSLLKKVRISNMKLTFSLFWLTTLTSLSVNLYGRFATISYKDDLLAFWIDFGHLTIVILQCFLLCIDKKDEGCEKKRQSEGFVHPQETASWFSDYTLSWALDSLRFESNRTLEETDICELALIDQSHHAVTIFERSLRMEKMKIDKDSKHQYSESDGSGLTSHMLRTEKTGQPEKIRISLVRILIKTFGCKYLFFQFLKALGGMTSFLEPFLMSFFMNFIQNRDHEHWSNGVFIVLAVFITNVMSEVFDYRMWASVNRFSKQVRSSIMLTVFKKSLTVRNECTKDLTTGEIVNLLSDDCDKVINVSHRVFQIISMPMKISISMYLLYNLIGDAMFVGLLIIILSIPLNRYVGKKFKNDFYELAENKDKRKKLMNEIINGIKVLKLYAWERSFMQKVQDIRQKETRCFKSASLIRACVYSMFKAIPLLVKLGAFAAFLVIGGHVDVKTGFVTAHLFHMLNHPCSLIAMAIPDYVEAAVSLKRINKFLKGEDIPHDTVTKKSSGKSAVSINEGIFAWEREKDIVNLKDINLEIPKGKLVAVVGKVGSGKSALISSILGEMEKLKGDVKVQGQIAYVPQEAWILNAPLQENVLFGSSMETARYKRVVHACALKDDINIMSAGDRTEIGEKGINLSGGQKQRVSLARAVYKDADVYLLDDPLSAVDAHVGKHIFHKVIGHKGLLRGKTRVLVTHGLHWLPFVDSIIVVKDGQISESGSYDQLMSHDGAFAQLLRDIQSKSSKSTDIQTKKVHDKIFKRLNSLHEVELIDADMDSSDSSSSDESYDEGQELKEWKCFDDVRNGSLIDNEELEQGCVGFGVYLEYVKAVRYKLVVVLLLMAMLTSVSDVFTTSIIKQWSDDPLLANDTFSGTDEYIKTNWEYFIWFAATGTIEVIFAFLYIVVMMRGTFEASTRLHNNLLYRILRCPMSFFDTTPACRIIIRFSKDVSSVDSLGGTVRHLVTHVFDMVVFILMIIIYCPTICIYLIPISILNIYLFHYHIGSIRQLRRFKSKHRSPMFVHFTETLHGVASIRAYRSENRFIQTMEDRIDQCTKYELMELWSSVCLKIRSSILQCLVTLISGLVCVMDSSMTAGAVAMVIMYAQHFSGTLKDFLWTMTHAENEMVSLERVIEYSNKPSEAAWELQESSLSCTCARQGHVSFNNYKTRYREGLDLVLKGVDCQIQSGEKVGIVGRTGAGKTTLTNAFFRLLEAADGNIQVDGQTIGELGLHDLRSRINILPQEPVIFSGSLRMNLDPFGRSSDEEIWTALQHSHLALFVDGLTGNLDFECAEGGKNLSVGQRQLLCLTRSLLRKAKILVLDEATAAVDMETDNLIQKTIRAEFKDCTVLTIAHRLNTIMDYDKIMVLQDGMVKEFDSPQNLLADQSSMFYDMAKDAKIV